MPRYIEKFSWEPFLPAQAYSLILSWLETEQLGRNDLRILRNDQLPPQTPPYSGQSLNPASTSDCQLSTPGHHDTTGDHRPSRYMRPQSTALGACWWKWQGWQDLNPRSWFWRPELWTRLSYTPMKMVGRWELNPTIGRSEFVTSTLAADHTASVPYFGCPGWIRTTTSWFRARCHCR